MFRSKAFSVLQSIINKNSYNIKHTNSFRRILFSTNTFQRNSSEGSINNSNEANKNFKPSVKISPEISVDATVGTSIDESSTESEPDKLYSKLDIEIRGNNPQVLNSYEKYASLAAKYLSLSYICLKQRKCTHDRLTVLKSVHVHKKHRVQYETRTYYKYFSLTKLTGSTADTYLEYIQRNLPEGVAMKVTKVELQGLPETITQANIEKKSNNTLTNQQANIEKLESMDKTASKNPEE